MKNRARGRWDLFCRVVDNFGDIGVCWRLARILAVEHGIATRLVVDQPEILRRIVSIEEINSISNTYRTISVAEWCPSLTPSTDTNVAVEVFACDPPEEYVNAMAKLPCSPLWINLEYLSAEAWVAGCHGLVSRHPRLGLDKHFVIPGFDDASAGLLREDALDARRHRFLSDDGERAALWRSLGVPRPVPGEMRVSLFGYENPAVPRLLDGLASLTRPVTVLVPEGRSVADLARRLGVPLARAGDAWRRDSLCIRIVPFTDQQSYDRLLWACQLNLVRGEDSLVRALWAGRAMLWQAYPQVDDAHHAKVSALVARLRPFVDPAAAADVETLWRLWNGMPAPEFPWGRLEGVLRALSDAIDAWRVVLANGPELAASLANLAERTLD
ncbi:MAG: elongation factor P maturation arginine rhamnosyltransferase EarP [Rhodocyclaceae bacterium]|nr:elongation factor P maturation arginine rhamnosyltransferase EarP [Rhodocyclaceae bacterium]